jgi:hypothetical protein
LDEYCASSNNNTQQQHYHLGLGSGLDFKTMVRVGRASRKAFRANVAVGLIAALAASLMASCVSAMHTTMPAGQPTPSWTNTVGFKRRRVSDDGPAFQFQHEWAPKSLFPGQPESLGHRGQAQAHITPAALRGMHAGFANQNELADWLRL